MTLGAFDRDSALGALENRLFDVLVIGGGITGAGVALDAASRGLRTALVEQHDFASGTSSRSSKMVHGGLRYIEQGEIGLVYEALGERQRLRKNAAHLVRELPFMIPVFTKDGLFNSKLARAFGTTLWTYDLTGGARIGKVHKKLSPAEVLSRMPSIKPEHLAGGFLYYDCRADDARLTLSVVRTAVVHHGAVALNRAKVVELSNSTDGVRSAQVEAGGRTVAVRARVIINATGVWGDQLRQQDAETAARTIRPAKGSHIVVDAAKVANQVAVVLPSRKDKRSVFVAPWGKNAYIGNTDADYDGDLEDPNCTDGEISYLLEAVNASTSLNLTSDDVTATWAGLRPLVADAETSKKTEDLSRRHQVDVSENGLITVAGGKLTTYRAMAADAVEAALEHLNDFEFPLERRCRTKNLTLIGADNLKEAKREARLHPLVGPARASHLIGRYGSETSILLAMIDQRPDLAEPLSDQLPYLAVEALYAARYEMAASLDDVLSRRLRAAIRNEAATRFVVSQVATLVAPELGWSSTDRDDHVADWMTQ